MRNIDDDLLATILLVIRDKGTMPKGLPDEVLQEVVNDYVKYPLGQSLIEAERVIQTGPDEVVRDLLAAQLTHGSLHDHDDHALRPSRAGTQGGSVAKAEAI